MKVTILAKNLTSADKTPLEILQKAGYEITDYGHLNLGAATREETVARLVGNSDAVIAGPEPYGETVFRENPNLKVISRKGIGYDAVDLNACRKYEVALLRTAGMAEGAVAEYVMACLLHFSRRIHMQNESMHSGKWERISMPGLNHKILGLVGFGGIGKEIALRAAPFGMKLLYYCRHPRKEWEEFYKVSYVDFKGLLALSDFVSVNVPLTEDTVHLFNQETLSLMKPDSILVNASRGPVVDTYALKKALDSGRLGGACIDVYDHEPCTDSPLISCKQAVLTPHTAAYTGYATAMINRMAAQNILDFFSEEPFVHGFPSLSDRVQVV